MKIPKTPPSYFELLKNVPDERLPTVLRDAASVDGQGRYLHWDELRHRPDPAFSADERWLRLKWVRKAGSRQLPLSDTRGQAFCYNLPDTLLRSLHTLDQQLAGHLLSEPSTVDGAVRDRYVLSNLIDEAISSSVLEGASTTRRVARAMLEQARAPRDLGERMIVNNFKAMRFVREHSKEPLSPELVLELHRVVTEGTLDDPAMAGCLRLVDDVEVVSTDDGAVLHTPPKHQQLPERLAALCAFVNQADGEPFIHPVVRAMLVHFQLAYDHPFVDGNGRTARALFYFCMARYGYWLAEFLSISHVILQAPAQYGRAFLYTETDDNDTTYFLLHQLDVIERALAEFKAYLRSHQEGRGRIEQSLRQDPELRSRLNHRQVELIRHALAHPGELYRIDEHRTHHGVVYQSARSDLLGLVELGLFEQFKRGRAFQFMAKPDLERRLSG